MSSEPSPFLRALGFAALAFVAQAFAGLPADTASAGETGVPARPFLVYHESWYERPATHGAATTLSILPAYMNMVALAFVRPDLVYAGGLDLQGTGLQYQFTGTVLRDAIAILKRDHPQTRVLLAIGGATYTNWRRLDAEAVARLVRDLGADGVDIDLEPPPPQCAADAAGKVRCLSDGVWLGAVRLLRAALPRPYLLTVPGWSVGAYGEGEWRNEPPASPYTGMLLPLLNAPEAASIDLVSIMAYDAGPSFDRWQAFRAYRQVWAGPLALGVQVRTDAAAEPSITAAEAEQLARRVADEPRAGMMLYPLLARPPGAVGPENPDGRLLARALCRGLGSDGCEQSLP
ncbi:glycoside hydrolase family 18 protein [Arenibaculum pallidiluteum]|uniref:glycosyl hydrolase family 18 protein n=1 Tax=Arenibaculum pallidiluteum TaxID=2812559 RepID=UPI001A96E50D|nr:glycosyl hydrolase family 18 protein [Arenibaculum pallidiluteum]